MKTIDLRTQTSDLGQVLHLADGGSVLVVAPDGREYVVAEADDFEAEVEALRNSTEFQSFLDGRMAEKGRVSIAEVERELGEAK